jgi:hypothetical protein
MLAKRALEWARHNFPPLIKPAVVVRAVDEAIQNNDRIVSFFYKKYVVVSEPQPMVDPEDQNQSLLVSQADAGEVKWSELLEAFRKRVDTKNKVSDKAFEKLSAKILDDMKAVKLIGRHVAYRGIRLKTTLELKTEEYQRASRNEAARQFFDF